MAQKKKQLVEDDVAVFGRIFKLVDDFPSFTAAAFLQILLHQCFRMMAADFILSRRQILDATLSSVILNGRTVSWKDFTRICRNTGVVIRL